MVDEPFCVEVSGYFPVRTYTIAQGMAVVVAGLEQTDQAERIGEIRVWEPFATRSYGWVRYIGWLPPPGVVPPVRDFN
jgi:hypothetical protein